MKNHETAIETKNELLTGIVHYVLTCNSDCPLEQAAVRTLMHDARIIAGKTCYDDHIHDCYIIAANTLDEVRKLEAIARLTRQTFVLQIVRNEKNYVAYKVFLDNPMPTLLGYFKPVQAGTALKQPWTLLNGQYFICG